MSGTASECFELVDTDPRLANAAARVVKGAAAPVRRVSAAEGFRRFDWFSSVPIPNGSAILRGTLTSAKARVVFEHSSSADLYTAARQAGSWLRRRTDGTAARREAGNSCHRADLLAFDGKWADTSLDAMGEMMRSVTNSATLHVSGDRLYLHIEPLVKGHAAGASRTMSTLQTLARTMPEARVVESTVPQA